MPMARFRDLLSDLPEGPRSLAGLGLAPNLPRRRDERPAPRDRAFRGVSVEAAFALWPAPSLEV